MKPVVLEDVLSIDTALRVVGQEGTDDGTSRIRHIVWNRVITAPDLGKEVLRIAIEERVVAH